MKVLITSAGSRLPRELATSLSEAYEVILSDRMDVSTDHSFVRCDLGHDASTNELAHGVDGIVHLGRPDSSIREAEQLDFQIRCT